MTPEWRKSSYSSGNGQCVELAHQWSKASYSGGNGECVEVAPCGAIRDSKNTSGPQLTLERPALTAFLSSIKSGTFDA